jgi:hypothetical protein
MDSFIRYEEIKKVQQTYCIRSEFLYFYSKLKMVEFDQIFLLTRGNALRQVFFKFLR